MTPRFSARDEQLLSDYLDGRLSEREKAAFEKLLKGNQTVRGALLDMRRAKVVLKRAPGYRTPRNFTLTPEMIKSIQKPSPGIWLPLMRFASAAAVFVLAAVFILEGLPGGIPALRVAEKLDETAPAALEYSVDSALIPDSPPIILWNVPAEGRGGGGNGEIIMEAQPAPAQIEAQEKMEPEPQIMLAPGEPLATPEMPEGMTQRSLEEAAEAPPAAAMMEPLPPTPQQFIPESRLEEQPSNAGADAIVTPNILGIRPQEERAQISRLEELMKVVPSAGLPAGADQQQKENPLWIWIKTALVLIALSTGTAAVLLQRMPRK
jgi:hypothetical protein